MTGWVLLDEIDRFATQALTERLAEAHREEQNERAAAWWTRQYPRKRRRISASDIVGPRPSSSLNT